MRTTQNRVGVRRRLLVTLAELGSVLATTLDQRGMAGATLFGVLVGLCLGERIRRRPSQTVLLRSERLVATKQDARGPAEDDSGTKLAY